MVTISPRKKIEILVDTPLLRRLREVAEDVEADGYTVQRTQGGKGSRGRWFDDQVTGGAGSKVVFTTILDEATADHLLQALEPLMDEYGLLVTVSDVDLVQAQKS